MSSLDTLLNNLTVGDILPPRKTVIFFRPSDTIATCLKTLKREMLLSAPVVDMDNNKVIAIVDMLDFVLCAIGLFPKDVTLDNITPQTIKEVVLTGDKFANTPLASVLELSNAVKTDYQHLFTVTRKASLSKLLDFFALGVHRVPVIMEDLSNNNNNEEDEEEAANSNIIPSTSNLLSILSQSDLVAFLAQCLPLLDKSTKNKSISQLGLITEKVTSVPASMKTIQVLYRMNREIRRPILSAVPVVDDNTGEIVASFSTSDLKGLSRSNFVSLLTPVIEYLKFQSEENRKKPFPVRILHQRSLHPITCSKDTSFEEIVTKMVAYKIHRVWVVDEMNRPIGVVSQGDVFKVFLPWYQNYNKSTE